MKSLKQLAIIGPTASGKTSLAIKVAKSIDAYILSLDSLSIYQEVDIVSAKPSLEEREGILHFGIDCLLPDEHFDVNIYIQLYHEVYQRCLDEGKNLVIVGGTSFYLKMLIEGISTLPTLSEANKNKAATLMEDTQACYTMLYALDSAYMSKIEKQDSYRIEKALLIYLETGLAPSLYFSQFPPIPTIRGEIEIYHIVWEREILRERIALRTKLMIEEGLIDEICRLEKRYTRLPNCMKSIGIKETLGYLDGLYTKEQLIEKITTNTARLAKRQNTFNNSQFEKITKGSIEILEQRLL